jgi:hypothetical protein
MRLGGSIGHLGESALRHRDAWFAIEHLGHAASFRNSSMLPGFSDDGEGGEEIPGEGMVVLGRGIPSLAGEPAGNEVNSGRQVRQGQSGGIGGQSQKSGPLMVSGIKLGDAPGLAGGEARRGFEFPGFSSTGGHPSGAGSEVAEVEPGRTNGPEAEKL